MITRIDIQETPMLKDVAMISIFITAEGEDGIKKAKDMANELSERLWKSDHEPTA